MQDLARRVGPEPPVRAAHDAPAVAGARELPAVRREPEHTVLPVVGPPHLRVPDGACHVRSTPPGMAPALRLRGTLGNKTGGLVVVVVLVVLVVVVVVVGVSPSANRL